MTRKLSPIAGVLALALAACNQTSQGVTLQSLESSGEASFVCLAQPQGGLSSPISSPRDIKGCPDVNPADGEDRHLYSLVTQTTRGEVAVVDLTAGTVFDEEPSIPGFNFLPIGAQPTGIVSTPGSVATFVGVGQPGKEGIFALPSTCVAAKSADRVGPVYAITTWPACRLSSAPGRLAILVDPPRDAGNGRSEIRSGCSPDAPAQTDGDSLAATRADCPADLSTETDPPGRRKLAVSLPDEGVIAILDAQAILDRTPGSYEPCDVEAWVPLKKEPSTAFEQELPPDLAAAGALCSPAGLVHNPSGIPDEPRPAGFAQLDDPVTQEHRLYVADLQQPVVHVVDTTDPCRPTEIAPLRPVSYTDPKRAVTTSRIAVMDRLTTAQKRYLYAIDQDDGGSVMVFDVSPDSTNPTPLVRSNAARLPFEAPDRIKFDAPAADVAFGFHDPPTEPDPVTGTQGYVLCNPDPAVVPPDPAALYRPSVDHTTGAAPATLRGMFGFFALTTGGLATVDVEDFDAKCRRPIQTNPSSTPDYRGCVNDDPSIPFFTLNRRASGVPTVSNEVSCNVVETNLPRSSVLLLNDPNVGVRAPALGAFPRLVDASGRALSAQQSTSPKMLAVRLPGQDTNASVYVGTTLYEETSTQNQLIIDPGKATQNSVSLDVSEPRAYLPQESFFATYEGVVTGERPAGSLARDPQTGGLVLTDTGVQFCDAGVEDRDAARARASERLHVDPAKVDAFANAHADYVLITDDLLPEDDSYWRGDGAKCGGADPNQPGAGFLQCQIQLGTGAAPKADRELRITAASANQLTVEPRNATNNATREYVANLVSCCFPQAFRYTVRASGEWVVKGTISPFQHAITTNTLTGECMVDCNPLKSRLDSRAIEVSCDPNSPACSPGGVPVIGLATPDEVAGGACVIENPATDLKQAGVPGSECIFQNTTTSFVIYRGVRQTTAGATVPGTSSTRDMTFSWQVTGGFSPSIINLATAGDPNTLPQSLVFQRQLGALVATDGSTKGLIVLDLGTLAPISYF